MLNALVVLLGCQLVGEAAARAFAGPVPGPVIGATLLAVVLFARRGVPPALSETAHGILRHLSLLFVPAAVGLVQHADLVAAHGAALLATLVVSAIVTMVATVATFRLLARWLDRSGDRDGEAGA